MVICGERGRRANAESHFCKHPTSENGSVQWNMTIEISVAAIAAGLFTLHKHTHTRPDTNKYTEVDLTRHYST